MDERNISLKKAVRLNMQAIAAPTASTSSNPSDSGWTAITANFLKSRSDRRSSTLRDLELRVQRAVEALETTPKPRGGLLLWSVIRSCTSRACHLAAKGESATKRYLHFKSALCSQALRCTSQVHAARP